MGRGGKKRRMASLGEWRKRKEGRRGVGTRRKDEERKRKCKEGSRGNKKTGVDERRQGGKRRRGNEVKW